MNNSLLSREEIYAYAAGILDGEGCICIRRKKDKPEYASYFPYLGITSTNIDLIKWLQDTFGGYASSRKGKTVSSKDTWDWRLTSAKDIVLFIEKMYKYLIIKRKQSQIMLFFIHRGYQDSGIDYYEQMCTINGGKSSGFSKDVRKAETGSAEEMPI